jgi:putative ABC transport system permease protein
MLGNVFLTFYRVTTRHPLYAALDLLGLSFGVAVFITLSLYVRYETSFESWIPNADQVYEARTRYTMPGKPTRYMDFSSAKLMEALKSDYPDLTAARFHETDADVAKGASSSRETEILADGDFFKLFDLPLIAGDRTALSEPGRVMLSDSMARKYLSPGEGVGATIRLRDAEGDIAYLVSAIFADPPHNSDLHFGLIRLLTPAFFATQDKWDKWAACRCGPGCVLPIAPRRTDRTPSSTRLRTARWDRRKTASRCM